MAGAADPDWMMERAFGGDVMPKVTLEQWRMLKAVVDSGGFAKAAELVHKSPSSVNHAVQKLQKQLGVRLLEVRGRRAELTLSGEVLLRRAGQLLDEAADVEDLASALGSGLQLDLTLAVDQVVPQAVVVDALREFANHCPKTRVVVYETLADRGLNLLETGQADLLVGPRVPGRLPSEPLGQVRMICVAHHSHPLARPGMPLAKRDLRHSRHVVIRALTDDLFADSGWLDAEQRWTVEHVDTALRIVEEGIAFAWLPECLVREGLDRGRLKALDLEIGAAEVVPFALAFADRDRAGLAVLTLAEILGAAFANRVPESEDVPDWWSLARCGSRVNL